VGISEIGQGETSIPDPAIILGAILSSHHSDLVNACLQPVALAAPSDRATIHLVCVMTPRLRGGSIDARDDKER
jgi:hypothetical protein